MVYRTAPTPPVRGVTRPTPPRPAEYAECGIRTELPGGGVVGLEVRTRYPEEGLIRVTVTETPDRAWKLSLRVPGWADRVTLRRGDVTREVGPGDATVEGPRAAGDTVELDLPMRARWTWPDPEIDALRGKVAVERGPVVYRLESVDMGHDVETAEVVVVEPPVDEDSRVLVPVRVGRSSAHARVHADHARRENRSTGVGHLSALIPVTVALDPFAGGSEP